MLQIRYLLFIVINLWSVCATKYCSYELNGDPKYFVCARNEYCCNLGCCVHLAFQFYQLWYYWLLLIFMFMICSGGSWWYKFCRQNDNASHYPSIPLTVERSARQNFSELHGRRAAARAFDRNSLSEPSSYHFHRIWKANTAAPSPNYYTTSVVRYHNTDLDARRQHYECPYYQLYGPPPSYESVVQISDNGNNGQTSCVLVPTPSASTTQLASSTVSSRPIPTSSSNQNISSPSRQAHAISMTISQTIGQTKSKHCATLTTSPTSSESSPIKTPPSSPLAPKPTTRNLLHATNNQNSIPSTSEILSQPNSTGNDQQRKTTYYPVYHHKKHHQSHHILHHPTIHSIDVNTNLSIGKSSSSTSSANRFHGRFTAATSGSSTISIPPSPPPPPPTSSPAMNATIQPSVPLTSPTPSDPIDENGTRV